MKDFEDTDIEGYFKTVQNKDGILFCGRNEVESRFSDIAQDNLFEIEDTSWWFQYRARVIEQIARDFLKKESCLFDIGGGNGYTTHHLQKSGYNVVLLEPSLAACFNARKRGLQTVVCGTLAEDTIKDASMKQIMLLDVLEHIEEDGEFLKLIWGKLEFGGRVLLTVPAFQLLWSSEDDNAGHYRRYRLSALKELTRAAGFKVLYINYFFKFLFLPILVVRVGLEKIGLIKRSEQRTEEEKKHIAQGQFQEQKGIIGWVLDLLECIEIRRLVNSQKIRYGSSIICMVEKEKQSL